MCKEISFYFYTKLLVIFSVDREHRVVGNFRANFQNVPWVKKSYGPVGHFSSKRPRFWTLSMDTNWLDMLSDMVTFWLCGPPAKSLLNLEDPEILFIIPLVYSHWPNLTWLVCVFCLHIGLAATAAHTICTKKIQTCHVSKGSAHVLSTYMKADFEGRGINIVCYFNAIDSGSFIYHAPFFSIYSTKSFYFVCLRYDFNQSLLQDANGIISYNVYSPLYRHHFYYSSILSLL